MSFDQARACVIERVLAERVFAAPEEVALECAAGQGYQIVSTSDGPAVQFEGNCLLQPDDTWDLRYLTNR